MMDKLSKLQIQTGCLSSGAVGRGKAAKSQKEDRRRELGSTRAGGGRRAKGRGTVVWTPPSQGQGHLPLPFLGSRCEFCTQLQRSGSSWVRGGPAVPSSCGKNEEASGGGVEREGRSAEGASREEARGPAPDLRPQAEGGARWGQAEALLSNHRIPGSGLA